MSSYKSMYLELFLSTNQVIDKLKSSQLKAEKMYISALDNNLKLSGKNNGSSVDALDEPIIKTTYSATTIGKNIRALREKHGISIKQLANVQGITASYLSLLELGERNLTLQRMCSFANFFGVTLESFLVEDPNNNTVITRKPRNSNKQMIEEEYESEEEVEEIHEEV